MRGAEKRWREFKGYIYSISLFLVFILVVLLLFFSGVQRSIERNVKQALTDNIERQSAAFCSNITIQYQYLEGFAGYLGQKGELYSDDTMALMQQVCEKSGLERIALIEPDGTARYSSGEVKNVSERDYFKQAMDGERCLSNPLESAVDGETRVILSVPIRKDEEIVGVLGGSYDVGALSHMLFDDVYGGTGYSLIITADGEIVAYDGTAKYRKIQPSDNFFEYYKKMTFMQGDTYAAMRQSLAERESDSIKLRNQEDVRYLSYTPIELNEWTMCYIVPEKTAEAAYRKIMQYEVWLLIAVLIGMAALLILIFRMMTSRQKELVQAAQIDELTGVLNKKSTGVAIDLWLQEEHAKAQAFLMLDVDKFKEINDQYGHAAGDAALRLVGQTLKSFFREGDVIGRIGGDEFVVLMKQVNSMRDAELKAEALCVMFQSLHPDGCPEEVHLSCSIGLAEVPEHGTSYMELYRKADQALYESKRGGRNRWTRFEGETAEETAENVTE